MSNKDSQTRLVDEILRATEALSEARPKYASISIRTAVHNDLPWLCWLHARNSEALGFIPRRGMEIAIDANRVLLAQLNGEPAAYILHGVVRNFRPVTIFQACVQYDARRQWIGIQLIDELCKELRDAQVPRVDVKFRDGHDATEFWLNAGFTLIELFLGGRKRAKPIWHCERNLVLPNGCGYQGLS
jgi:ribosomal protein S18 acetylase RimI-like enzyme